MGIVFPGRQQTPPSFPRGPICLSTRRSASQDSRPPYSPAHSSTDLSSSFPGLWSLLALGNPGFGASQVLGSGCCPSSALHLLQTRSLLFPGSLP